LLVRALDLGVPSPEFRDDLVEAVADLVEVDLGCDVLHDVCVVPSGPDVWDKDLTDLVSDILPNVQREEVNESAYRRFVVTSRAHAALLLTAGWS
jgi:hypothetical protein